MLCIIGCSTSANHDSGIAGGGGAAGSSTLPIAGGAGSAGSTANTAGTAGALTSMAGATSSAGSSGATDAGLPDDSGLPASDAGDAAAPLNLKGPEVYFGITVDPGACLDVVGGAKTDGTELEEWSCNASGAQSFLLADAGNGAVRLVNTQAQKCLQPAAAGTANGTKIQLATCDGSAAQHYILKDEGNGLVSLLNVGSGKCLDVPNANVAAGTRIALFDCNKSPAQLWTRAPIGKGFTKACSGSQLQAGRMLAANCQDDTKDLTSPVLDLNACLSNSDGALAWQNNGGFAGSCTGCVLRGGSALTCQCKNVAAQSVATTIDLSASINACNGVLTCGACGGNGAKSGGARALTALYGSDGNDFYRFTGQSSLANLKPSGWSALFLFAITVQGNGDITAGGSLVVHDGAYVGDANWGANVAALKTPPTTVTRYEVTLGGWGDKSFDAIQSLNAAQGTGAGSTLYKNFQALKKACPGIDAINDDDEQTYDIGSSTAFGKMLNGLGMKLTQAPYMNQGFWVQLKNNLGAGCDVVYLQCYQGGAGNDPGQWNGAYGNGFRVVAGLESNDHSTAWWTDSASKLSGGFYWPDVTWAPNANWGVGEIANGLGLAPP